MEIEHTLGNWQIVTEMAAAVLKLLDKVNIKYLLLGQQVFNMSPFIIGIVSINSLEVTVWFGNDLFIIDSNRLSFNTIMSIINFWNVSYEHYEEQINPILSYTDGVCCTVYLVVMFENGKDMSIYLLICKF